MMIFQARLRQVSLLICLLTVAVGCHNSSGDAKSAVVKSMDEQSSTPAIQEVVITAELTAQVDKLCGYCHAVPLPEHYPKEAWRKEVEQGFHFHFASGNPSIFAPPIGQVISYYEQQAPESIDLPPASAGVAPGKLRFRQEEVPGKKGEYAIAHLNWTILADATTRGLVASDMRTGRVSYIKVAPGALESTDIAQLSNPAHAEICDLNADGLTDLVVAELGSYPPSDHDRGAVIWLKRLSDSLEFEPVRIATGLGRVADVQSADLDNDGDTDLIVAEFGWRTTGRILKLINQGPKESPRFELHVVDQRHGSIHVPTLDFNRDGRTDFIALLSQEHESVELFLNDGLGEFQKEKIFAADRPSFGSSGIFPVDLDQDSDLDVVYSNGDLFDDWYLRTYHAVHWLENRGSDGWAHHELGPLPGVHRALAADMDGDQDLDVVGVGLIPRKVMDRVDGRILDSIVWFEQTSPGRFERHVLEAGNNSHAALSLDDFDRDGDIDMAVGNYATSQKDAFPLVTLWWNITHEGP